VRKIAEIQRALWDCFSRELSTISYRFDAAIWNGDLIDGRGEKSGGTELISTDRQNQCDMAIEIIQHVNAKRNLITRGTPYHVGQLESFEDSIADSVGAEIGDQIFPAINGYVLDVKHKSGTSSVPHAVNNGLRRQAIWNMLWDERGIQPKAQATVRAHAHRFCLIDNGDWQGVALPALQGLGTRYGSRECEGVVDFGFMILHVSPGGNPTWEKCIRPVVTQAKKTIVL
jgi:hypothetical protein